MMRALRPTSDDFPRLSVRMSDGAVKVKESERVLDEKVTTKTEEYVDENGEQKVRTVEIVEKIIEKEVLCLSQFNIITAWPQRRTLNARFAVLFSPPILQFLFMIWFCTPLHWEGSVPTTLCRLKSVLVQRFICIVATLPLKLT